MTGLVCALAIPGAPAQRELTPTARFPCSPGKTIQVDAADLNVFVRVADVAQLQVATELSISGVSEEKADAWIRRHTPEYADSEEILVITVKPGKERFLGLGLLTARAHMTIVMPVTAIPDITTTSGRIHVRGDFPQATPLHLRSATGDIELVGAAGSVEIHSTSGDSLIDVMRPLAKLFARTASGDVNLEGGAQQVTVDTASGAIRLMNLSGSADVSTSTGKVFLRWDRLDPDDAVKVISSSSRLQLTLPAHLHPQGTLRTVSGSIRSDFPGIVNEGNDTVFLKGDGPHVTAETASGQITLGLETE